MKHSDSSSRQTRLRDGVGILCALIWILAFASTVPCTANAQALSVTETETLVRMVYFEGLPEDEASRIGPAGATRLVEMLADSDESASHANILLALGYSGDAAALPAIRAWAQAGRSGEVDRDTFRAWQILPYALGSLAKDDANAVTELESCLNEDTPNWTFRHHRGARLHRMNRRAAARALGESGHPAARVVLDRAARNSSDPEFSEDLRRARSRHSDRARGGAK